MRSSVAALCLVSLLAAPRLSAQDPGREVRAAFSRFVTAQNAHDLKAVGDLLSDSPDLLWITRGTAVWGRAEALKRFEILYRGTWHLTPDDKEFRIVLARPDVVEIFVPILFSIGAAGQAAQETRFLMNQTWVHGEGGWKLASILPIPLPPPAPAK